MQKHPKIFILSRLITITAIADIAANTIAKTRIITPDSYDFLLDVAIVPVSLTNDPNLAIGLRKNTEEIIDKVHNSFLQASTAVAPNDKFLGVYESLSRDSLFEVVTETSQSITIGNSVSFYFVARLTNEAAFLKYNNREEALKLIKQ